MRQTYDVELRSAMVARGRPIEAALNGVNDRRRRERAGGGDVPDSAMSARDEAEVAAAAP